MLQPPIIILVGAQLGENIGMVARAMANFGFSQLRLVAPREGWLTDKTIAAAAKAGHLVEQAELFDTLEAALADVTYVIATTARQRDAFKPVLGPQGATRQMLARGAAGQRTAVLFGREKSGLSNEEISRADAICTFPVNPDFASLNIAQAVLLMAYEWTRQSLDGADATPFASLAMEPAERGTLIALTDWLEQALDERGFFKTEPQREKLTENLRALLMRPGFTRQEISMLRGVFTAFERFAPRAKGDAAAKRPPKTDGDANG
jgi:tRNA/rRNA methyltransferase